MRIQFKSIRWWSVGIVVMVWTFAGSCMPQSFESWHEPGDLPPRIPREFRAAWVASVTNIDWPSRPGLSAAKQQEEIVAILDHAAKLKLNAIILQVRTSCDALYPSEIEPWSEYLTGVQGKGPEPLYDPLAMWIDEAHRRGIELHAWFNPFRARHPEAKGPEAPNHISKTRPGLVKQYGKFLWLDPGEVEAQEYTQRVFLDVLRRYDIDGIHIDDYFYPYPLSGVEFPDEASWQRYVSGGGTLSRGDWRRANINHMIERLYVAIKQEKRWVKFGISPFGIWKPGYPPSVKGFNQYESLYADAKLWLNRGWCDYFTPQLYWKISATSQPYGDLLDWWIGENTQGRHIWPGNYTSRIADGKQNWRASEIIDQISRTRAKLVDSGNVHFSMKALMENRDGIAGALSAEPYARPALMPASPWLGGETPGLPKVKWSEDGVDVWWSSTTGEKVWLWCVYIQVGSEWRWQIYPGNVSHWPVNEASAGQVTAVAVSAVDRIGNEGPRALFRR